MSLPEQSLDRQSASPPGLAKERRRAEGSEAACSVPPAGCSGHTARGERSTRELKCHLPTLCVALLSIQALLLQPQKKALKIMPSFHQPKLLFRNQLCQQQFLKKIILEALTFSAPKHCSSCARNPWLSQLTFSYSW